MMPDGENNPQQEHGCDNESKYETYGVDTEYRGPYWHHPVDIGNTINDRYRILHLLRRSSFAKVWLAQDLQAESQGRSPLVSLKIAKAKILKGEPGELSIEDRNKIQGELNVHRHIQSLRDTGTTSEMPGSKYVVELYDDFIVKGPNGLHHCVVMEACGPSVSDLVLFIGHTMGLPDALRRRLALQLTEGVAFLQSCNIAHGNLDLKKVLIRPPFLDKWGPEDVQKAFGDPSEDTRYSRNPRPPRGPEKEVFPVWIRPWGDLIPDEDEKWNASDFLEFEIRIVDFEESFISQPLPASQKYMAIPSYLAAPEVLVRKCRAHVTNPSSTPQQECNGDGEGSQEGRGQSESVDPSGNTVSRHNSNPEAAKKQAAYEIVETALKQPEVKDFLTIDIRSDLWSLGAVLRTIFLLDFFLFGEMAGDTAEDIIYEMGCTLELDSFVKLGTWMKPEKSEVNTAPISERLEELEGQETLRQVIMGLLAVKAEDRLPAATAAKLLNQARYSGQSIPTRL